MDTNSLTYQYLVQVSNKEEEKKIFDLTIKNHFIALPINQHEDCPVKEPMDFWQVKIIPYPEAEKIAVCMSPRDDQTKSSNPANHLVVSIGDYKQEGTFFADFTKRSFHHCPSWESFLRLRKKNTTLTMIVITDVSHLPYPLLSELLMLEDTYHSEGTQIGFITGYNQTQVRWSIVKALLLHKAPRYGDLFLFGYPNVFQFQSFTNINTLWWEDLNETKIKDLATNRFYLAALVSHSNGVDGNFSQGILCPQSDLRSNSPVTEPLKQSSDLDEGKPSCVYTFLCQRDPQGNRYRFHPHSLQNAVTFYDTCAGFLTRGAFAFTKASLGLSFISGTPGALITSIRKKASNVNLALLFRAFLCDGYSLGRITQLLNKYQYSEFKELPSFILFGDPCFCLEEKKTSSDVKIERTKNSICIQDWNTRSLKLDATFRNNFLVPDEQNKDLLCIDFSRTNEIDREWWLIRQNISTHSVHVREPEIKVLIQSFTQLLQYLRQNSQFIKALYKGLCSFDPKINGEPLMEIINTAEHIIPTFNNTYNLLQSRSWCYVSFHTLEDHMKQLLISVNLLNKLLPLAWKATKQWAVLHHYYSHSLCLIGDEQQADQRCPSCGMWMSKKLSIDPAESQLKRIMYICIRCGVVADIPHFVSLPVIEGPHRCAVGSSIKQKVVFGIDVCGVSRVEILGYFGGFGSTVVNCTIEPATLTREVKAGKLIEAEIKLNFAKDCPPGLYSLVIFASWLLTPIIAAKYIHIEPR